MSGAVSGGLAALECARKALGNVFGVVEAGSAPAAAALVVRSNGRHGLGAQAGLGWEKHGRRHGRHVLVGASVGLEQGRARGCREGGAEGSGRGDGQVGHAGRRRLGRPVPAVDAAAALTATAGLDGEHVGGAAGIIAVVFLLAGVLGVRVSPFIWSGAVLSGSCRRVFTAPSATVSPRLLVGAAVLVLLGLGVVVAGCSSWWRLWSGRSRSRGSLFGAVVFAEEACAAALLAVRVSVGFAAAAHTGAALGVLGWQELEPLVGVGGGEGRLRTLVVAASSSPLTA